MPNDNRPAPLHCSFCGKSDTQVRQLISGGDNVHICDECIRSCTEMLAQQAVEIERDEERLLTPQEIKARLDEYVIGQDSAKKNLAVAVHNHYKRVFYADAIKDAQDAVELEKSNILLVGPSGSGKTLLAKTLARILRVPFAIADATTLTEAGYVGEDVENILVQLLQNADYDLEAASKGIIYIDEIDKISPEERRTVHHPRCFRRGRSAGPAQDYRRHGSQYSAQGRPQASPAGIHPYEHFEYSVHRGRCVHRSGQDRGTAHARRFHGVRAPRWRPRRSAPSENCLRKCIPTTWCSSD